MVRSDLSSVLQYIRGLAAADKLGSVPDRQLLRRFVDFNEEAAFATLLQRHGPMVLGLCRRVLRQTQDAEDAFQATFLLLARGAGGIRNPDAVGGWLHGVALRVASKLRAKAARQSKLKSEEQEARSEKSKFNSSLLTPHSSLSADDPIEEATWKELRVVLDEELDRLPMELRAPLVLCYLEGRTQDEGARQLGWSRRVFRRRLEKGRARMARRLARRGITLSTALFAVLLSQEAPAMTAALWLPALQAALAVTTGRAAGGISTTALGLAEGFVPPLVMSKGKWMLALLLCLNLAATGLGIWVTVRGTERQPPQVGQASRLSQTNTDRRDAGPTPLIPVEGAAPKGVELIGTTAVLHGCVQDASGRVVPHARLVVLARRRYRPGEHGLRQEVLRQGETDADGRFRLVVPADFPTWYAERQVAVAAAAPGHAPGTVAVPLRAEQPFLTVRLAADRPLRGRLTDRDANPVAGVRLEVVRLGNVLREVIQTTDEGANANAPLDLWPTAATTNAAGEFELPGLGTVRNVWLQINDDRFAVETWPAEFSDGRPIDGQPYGIMVVPGQVLQGTVTAADTGKPIPHARLTAVSPNEWTTAPRQALHRVAQEAAPRASCSEFDARADAAGRFRLRLPTGRFFRLEAHAPSGSPYLALSRTIDRKDNKDLQKLNFTLPRGVLLTARVHDATGQPVPGAVGYYVPDRDNQRASGDVLHGCDAHALSGADGRLRLAVPPGRGRLCVHAPDGDFLSLPYHIQGEADGRVSYAHAIRNLDLPAEGGTVDVDVPLQKGVSITGKVVGPDGRPVAAGILISARHVHPLNPSTARPLPLSGGAFVLPGCEPGRTYPVLFLNAERRLGTVADLTAGAREQPPVVRLQPCGRATVRFADAEGRPLANQVLTPFVLLEPDFAAGDEAARRRVDQAVPHEMAWADPWVYHHCLGPHTEADGCITLTGLVPGVRYGLTQWDGVHHRRVLNSLTIRPGETLRLPDTIVPPGRDEEIIK